MSEISGGEVIVRMLQAEGVRKVFGIVDGTYTQLFTHCVELGMEMISPRHEAVAAHMAGAYARLTGRLGVCMASNGPGEANILPGLVVAHHEFRTVQRRGRGERLSYHAGARPGRPLARGGLLRQLKPSLSARAACAAGRPAG